MSQEVKMTDQKHVGIWVRVSTEDQAHGESPEHHEKHGRFYAESRNWKVIKVYRLDAVSGKSVMGVPETKEMLQDVASGKITGLIFSKLARLARNTRELLDFADYFLEHNADLVSLHEAIDTSTPAGRLFYTMVAAMAQWEREEIASRVSASVPIRAKLGKPLGGQAPFGYMWVDKELMPDPNEAPVRKLIYELFIEHRRKKTIARILNEKGFRTRNGSKFSDTTVDRLLRDPTAKGIRRANYTKSTGQGKKWELKPEMEWVEIPIEPIVAAEMWEKCNKILDEQRANRKKPAKKTAYLFSGFTYCQCGKKMYVPTKSPKYTCDKCKNKIRTDDLEEIFHSQLKNFFLSAKEIEGYLGQADKVIRDKEQLRDSIVTERKRVKSEMDKLYSLYLDNQISKEGFGERYKPLEERLHQIDDQMPELQGEIDFLRIQYLSSDEILHEARDLYSRWNKLSFEEKKKIIEIITEKIIVGKDSIEINLCYIPASWELTTNRQHTPRVALPRQA
jgi:site-specific DNA recombinase